jgi:hypothetical protein
MEEGWLSGMYKYANVRNGVRSRLTIHVEDFAWGLTDGSGGGGPGFLGRKLVLIAVHLRCRRARKHAL